MSENVLLFIFGLITTALGAVTMLLIGWIVWEVRQLRKEMKECVPDQYCKVMMTAHENRIKVLETQSLCGGTKFDLTRNL